MECRRPPSNRRSISRFPNSSNHDDCYPAARIHCTIGPWPYLDAHPSFYLSQAATIPPPFQLRLLKLDTAILPSLSLVSSRPPDLNHSSLSCLQFPTTYSPMGRGHHCACSAPALLVVRTNKQDLQTLNAQLLGERGLLRAALRSKEAELNDVESEMKTFWCVRSICFTTRFPVSRLSLQLCQHSPVFVVVCFAFLLFFCVVSSPYNAPSFVSIIFSFVLHLLAIGLFLPSSYLPSHPPSLSPISIFPISNTPY
ncbi:hypothetical protein FA13DRAFT_1455360 [Coprinellus micaceus]|uniref:Uncharacterized protein n=1 Tax=Coprinellus micaceus TaxID=71717 RepID=A0A4Y7SML4_COPMI|nr:hypothetical protein FA13DRAFT_1455360 [Coprinellus micaceus]